MEKRLSRGNNIVEGHYMERLWGAVLSTHLKPFQVSVLLDRMDDINTLITAFTGVLFVKP